MNLDWKTLRQQKNTIVELTTSNIFNNQIQEDLEGVLLLLDAIQDCAVDTKEATEHEVFGDMT